ncbi:MAG: hypothetical protein Q9190_007919 [Brigantiaea leucoxantha]
MEEICSTEPTGEIFRITVLGKQIVFIGGVALCEEVCDEKRFRKYVGGPVKEIRPATPTAMFNAFDSEAHWGQHHRIMAPLVTPSAVSSLFADVLTCASELTAKWRASDGKPVSAIDELNRLDQESTTLCFYGRKLNNITNAPSPMIAAMNGTTAEAMKRPSRPHFVNQLFYQSKFSRNIAKARKYASDCLNYRKAHSEIDRKDMLHTLMNAKDPETGKSLDREQIIDEMISLAIGSSTAPCIISHVLYHLLKNPECIRQAREEIDAVLDNSELTHESLDRLPYCGGIVRESLRLSAAMPAYTREPRPETNDSNRPVLLAGGKYEIPPNQAMVIVFHGVNRDPTVFEDPEAFIPERMVGERYESLPEGAKKIFGNGKRVCFGRHYAWMWLVTTVVTILKDVDLEMADPTYILKHQGWFNLRPVDFEIKAKSRA